MFAALGVGVLVAGLAVKVVQAEGILGEMGGHPVHDDTDAGLVELVHERHQIFGGAVAAGGGEIARDLIAPAAVEGILHHRQQFHMGVAHLADVGDQLIGQLRIVVGKLVILQLPAAHMHLVDVHRAVDHVRFLLGSLPGLIVPLKAADLVDLAAVGRPGLGVEGVGVSLVDQIARPGGHAVLVDIVFLHTGDKQLPDRIAIHFVHRMAARLPAVEITHHADGRGVRSPHAEHHSGLSGPGLNVSAEVAVSFAVVALLEQINRQIRWIFLDLFFRRFHKQLLPVQAAVSPYLFTLLY